MEIYRSFGKIYFLEKELGVLAYTDFDEKLWEIVKSTSWHVQSGNDGRPKYLRSSKLGRFCIRLLWHPGMEKNYFMK